MPDERIYDELEDRERQVLEIQLTTAAQISSMRIDEYIKIRLLQGATQELLEQELLTDLSQGGRLFGEFKNSIKATAIGNINKVADRGLYMHSGKKDKRQWITVGDNRVCESCGPRHGQIATWSAWEVLGFPRTGWSKCGSRCRCVLPVINEENPEIPKRIVRATRRQLKKQGSIE